MVTMDFVLVEGYYTSKAVSIERILSCSLTPWKGSFVKISRNLPCLGLLWRKHCFRAHWRCGKCSLKDAFPILVAICEVDETLILHQGLFVGFRPSI